MLLGAGRDFAGISKDAIGIAAVFAVEFFDPVQIGQMTPVQLDVFTAPHFGNAIDGKATRLVGLLKRQDTPPCVRFATLAGL